MSRQIIMVYANICRKMKTTEEKTHRWDEIHRLTTKSNTANSETNPYTFIIFTPLNIVALKFT